MNNNKDLQFANPTQKIRSIQFLKNCNCELLFTLAADSRILTLNMNIFKPEAITIKCVNTEKPLKRTWKLYHTNLFVTTKASDHFRFALGLIPNR